MPPIFDEDPEPDFDRMVQAYAWADFAALSEQQQALVLVAVELRVEIAGEARAQRVVCHPESERECAWPRRGGGEHGFEGRTRLIEVVDGAISPVRGGDRPAIVGIEGRDIGDRQQLPAPRIEDDGGAGRRLRLAQLLEQFLTEQREVNAKTVRNAIESDLSARSAAATPAKAGVEKFHCTAMAMGDGKIVVE